MLIVIPLLFFISVSGLYFEPITLGTLSTEDPDLGEEEVTTQETTEESINTTTKPPCELPPFTHLLPLHYRRELKKIWAGYSTVAKKCDRQLAQTRDLIDDLPYELKIQVMEYGKEVTEPPDKIPFLVGLNVNQLVDFSNIMSNRSISEAEKYERLREWGEKNLDMDAVTQMEQFIRFLDQRAKRFQEKVSKLSSEAKTAHERLESLRRTKQTIYNGLSESAKKELANLYRTKCPRGNAWDNADLDSDELHLACSSHGESRPDHPTLTLSSRIKVSGGKTTATPAVWTRLTTKRPIPIFGIDSASTIPPVLSEVGSDSSNEGSSMFSRSLIDSPLRLSDLLRKIFRKSSEMANNNE